MATVLLLRQLLRFTPVCSLAMLSPFNISACVIWLETARYDVCGGFLPGICQNDMQT
jgi:hypothetical protein